MNIALPFACLGIAVLSLTLRHQKPSTPTSTWILGAVLGLLVLILGSVASRVGAPDQMSPIWIGLGLGALAVAVGALIDGWGPHASALLAIGAAAPAFVLALATTGLDSAALAASSEAGVAALVFRLRSSSLVALCVSGVCLAIVLGSHSDSSFVHPAGGVVLTAGMALVSIASATMSRITPKWDRIAPPFISFLILVIAYAASIRYLSLGPGWIGLCLAPVAALIAYWLASTEDSRPDAFGLLVSAAIWLGLATAAFGLTKSFGVSLALVLAIGTLISLNADRALVSVGPLLAVVLTQTFKAIHPDAARSVDVGQHYVLIGLVLGALLPLIPEEWLERVKPPGEWRRTAAVALWVAILCASPLLIGIYLAPRGLMGFVAGLGFSGFFGSLRSPVALTVPALSAGLGCLTIKTYGWMGDLANLPRNDKIHWIEVGAFCLIVAAAVFTALGMGQRRPPATTTGTLEVA